MKAAVFLTTNPIKAKEANDIFNIKHNLNIDIICPDFEVIEIQADSCIEVAAYSAKYAANKLGRPCIISDIGIYVEALGGLPGPYNVYFEKRLGVEGFMKLLKLEKNRNVVLEDCIAYCEPDGESIVFVGRCNGQIAYEASNKNSRWLENFFIPNGENRTLSEIKEDDPINFKKYLETAKHDFITWYNNPTLRKTKK